MICNHKEVIWVYKNLSNSSLNASGSVLPPHPPPLLLLNDPQIEIQLVQRSDLASVQNPTTVPTRTHDEKCHCNLNINEDEVVSREISPAMPSEVAGDLIVTTNMSPAKLLLDASFIQTPHRPARGQGMKYF